MVLRQLYCILMMGRVADTGEVFTLPVSALTDKFPLTLTSHHPLPNVEIQQQLANLKCGSNSYRHTHYDIIFYYK